MILVQFKKTDIQGYDILEDGSLSHYWLLRHFKSERDVNDMKDILQGLTGGFLKDSAIQTDLRYTTLGLLVVFNFNLCNF